MKEREKKERRHLSIDYSVVVGILRSPIDQKLLHTKDGNCFLNKIYIRYSIQMVT